MEFLTLSWRSLHTSTYKLAEKIIKSGEQFDLIVGIARGGLTISHMLSDFLNGLPIATFTVASYHDLKQLDTAEISFKIGNRLHDKRVLLVDNVSDTGKTFIRGITYLKELDCPMIKTASPYIKAWTKFVPDYYVISTKKWIIYPFDIKENIDILVRKYKEKKITETQIRKKLMQLKLPKEYISRFAHQTI